MLSSMRGRPELQFAAALFRAAPGYAVAWWVLIIARGVLPAVSALAFGWLVSAVERDTSLTGPLILVGAVFTVLLIVQPLHQAVSANLGSRTAAHLYDRLMDLAVKPQGIGHLETSALVNDMSMARDFDLGITGPPLAVSMDFIATGLVDLVVGISAATLLFGFKWWIPPVMVAAWGSTHWLLRESGVWKDRNTDEVRNAQRHADYSYRLAVDAGPAKEVRYFGVAGWVIDRFIATRRHLYDLQYEATRLREKSVLLCLAVVLAANGFVFWLIADAAADGAISSARVVVFLQAAIGVSAIAFGGLNWALDGSAAPVAALHRLEAVIGEHDTIRSVDGAPTLTGAPDLAFRDVRFTYPHDSREVLAGFDLAVPAGSSLAIVGQNGAGKTTLAKLLCRLYDPTSGSITANDVPLTDLDLEAWRNGLTAVFQDFVRFELTLRQNVAPLGAPDDDVRAALLDAGAEQLAGGDLDTVLSKAYPGGTDLSGGQWQRVALARTLCAVRQGAGLVLLDEPTAQLDVRGESEIFERVLAATEDATTILISHRFSTVRLADRIAVVEGGRLIELGSHDELMAAHGRYQEMFDLQASRFEEGIPEYDERGEEVVHETL
ncbi:MAG: ABC transporter ATP-binding protein [Acidimicrobiales bacterium]|nr:ABC transporter ATP-binding protein [Acidimicrobiales bacterium]